MARLGDLGRSRQSLEAVSQTLAISRGLRLQTGDLC